MYDGFAGLCEVVRHESLCADDVADNAPRTAQSFDRRWILRRGGNVGMLFDTGLCFGRLMRFRVGDHSAVIEMAESADLTGIPSGCSRVSRRL